MKRILQTFILVFLCGSLFAQKVTISGYIKDKNTGEELIGATVSIDELHTGVSTNVYGFYSLSVAAGTYTVSFSYVGFVSQKEKMTLTKNTTYSLELAPSTTDIQEVVVSREAANKNVTSTEMSTTKLDMREVKSLPVLFGEKDIIKTLQLTPGVKAAGEGNSGFYVRGGSTDQNLIILDEAPVYNASHVFGFLSVFNTEAIKDVKLYKGNMPADYGGRLSAVLDIKMKEGNMKEYHGVASIGTIAAKLEVEGPIVKDKSSFMVSARRTYFDALFLPFAKDTIFKGAKLYFYDLNVKTNYKINDKNRIFLSGYFGKDILSLKNIMAIDWGNTTTSMRWNHLFNDKLFLNSTVLYSKYNYNVGFNFNGGDTLITMKSSIRDYSVKEDFQYYLNSSNNITFGISSIYHKFNPGEVDSKSTSISNFKLSNKYALESAIYIANDQTLTDRLKVNYGIRVSNFTLAGPFNSYIYNASGIVVDTSVYKDHQVVKSYYGFEPRLSTTYKLDEFSSMKASFSRTYQYMHLLQNSTVGTPFDYWVPSTDRVKPEYANQASLGYFRNIQDNMFETSVELYYKKMYNQVDYISGTQVLMNEYVENSLLYGIGRSYGAEFQIRKKSGKLTGWIGYTISKTQKKFDEIIGGKWFNAKQDRTHDISVVAVYQLSKTMSISGAWVYYTGDAITWPTGIYKVAGHYVESYSERNANRLPDYHRLDIGYNYTRETTKGRKHILNISVYNTYAKKNPYMIQFEADKDDPRKKKAMAMYLFPIPIPAISYTFEF